MESPTAPTATIQPNNIENRIMDFIADMKSHLKDGRVYSIDSAVWYLNATFNYTYAIWDSAFMYQSLDSTFHEVDLDPAGKVEESDLYAVYDLMLDDLEEHYDDISLSPKHVFLCIIINNGISGGKLQLEFISSIVSGYTINMYDPFNSTDYWFSIWDYGKCDHTCLGQDASDRLEYKLMHPQAVPLRIYFIPQVTIHDVDPWYYDYEGVKYGKRGFWYEGSGIINEPQCLDPDLLNFYLSNDGIPYMIDDNNPDPNELEFCGIDVRDEYMAGDRFWVEAHLLDIYYGTECETSTPPSGL